MPFANRFRAVVLSNLILLTASPVFAHHEAMFGPQSSAVLSPSTFLSAQIFDRENGQGADRHRETTTVFSGGVRPFKSSPLSLGVVVPITLATMPGQPSTHGFEDALVSARYRANADGFANAIGLDEGYVMGVAGLEVPTGNMDHAFGHGPFGQIVAGLVSVEKSPIAAIAYTYYHHTGVFEGDRESGNLFMGGGVAWTPIDDDAAGKLFSLQLGLSHEQTFAVEEQNMPLADSGGSGVFLHPSVVWQTNPRLQFFALVSLPVTQEWRSPSDHQRFRLGAGTILILKH